MTELNSNARELVNQLAGAAPFDQVAVVKIVADALPLWPEGLTIEEDGAAGEPLADALNTVLENLDSEATLAPADARQVAALLLPIAVSDPALQPLIATAAAEHEQNDGMNAIEILSGTAAVSFIILVATVEVDWKAGKSLRIVKRALGDEVLTKLVDVLGKLLQQKA